MKKLDENECLNLWISCIRKDKSTQFLYSERKGHIEELIEYFILNDIDQDTAQMMKRRAVEFLVTPEGMKGKDKHKNWKENAEADYDDAIQQGYVLPNVPKPLKTLKNAQIYDARIVKWAKNKFGEHVGEEIIKAAHQPLHSFWVMWMNDQHNLKPGAGL